MNLDQSRMLLVTCSYVLFLNFFFGHIQYEKKLCQDTKICVFVMLSAMVYGYRHSQYFVRNADIWKNKKILFFTKNEIC